MARRYIKIEVGCCGECPYYNWKKHKCSKGATAEVDYRIPFYDDCPLEWEEIEREEGENDTRTETSTRNNKNTCRGRDCDGCPLDDPHRDACYTWHKEPWEWKIDEWAKEKEDENG